MWRISRNLQTISRSVVRYRIDEKGIDPFLVHNYSCKRVSEREDNIVARDGFTLQDVAGLNVVGEIMRQQIERRPSFVRALFVRRLLHFQKDSIRDRMDVRQSRGGASWLRHV